MIVAGVVLVVLVLLLRRRARSRRVLAGLNGEAPVFSLAPPRRSLGRRRDERL